MSTLTSIGPLVSRAVLLLHSRGLTIIDPRRDLRSIVRQESVSRADYCADGWLRAAHPAPQDFFNGVSRYVPARAWRHDAERGPWEVVRAPGRPVHRGPVTMVWKNPDHADVFVDVQQAEALVEALNLPDAYLDFAGSDPTITGWFGLINWDHRPVDELTRNMAGAARRGPDRFQAVRMVGE